MGNYKPTMRHYTTMDSDKYYELLWQNSSFADEHIWSWQSPASYLLLGPLVPMVYLYDKQVKGVFETINAQLVATQQHTYHQNHSHCEYKQEDLHNVWPPGIPWWCQSWITWFYQHTRWSIEGYHPQESMTGEVAHQFSINTASILWLCTWVFQKAFVDQGSWNTWMEVSPWHLKILFTFQWKYGARCSSSIRSVAQSHRSRCGTLKILCSCLYTTEMVDISNYTHTRFSLPLQHRSWTHWGQPHGCMLLSSLDIGVSHECQWPLATKTLLDDLEELVHLLVAQTALTKNLQEQKILMHVVKWPPGISYMCVTSKGLIWLGGIMFLIGTYLGSFATTRLILSTNVVDCGVISNIGWRRRIWVGH